MNKKIIINELVNSIGENLSSIVRDLTEVVFDAMINEGIGREIPGINIIHTGYKTYVTTHQILFIKKIENFLVELYNVSSEERRKFVEELEKNPQKKRIFEEFLLLQIDSADSLEKPSILGRLFKHHIFGNISYEDAMRLAFIVNRVYMSDLDYLTRFSSGIQSNPNIDASLQSAGLLHLAVIDSGNLDESLSGGFIYELNDYGKMLLQYGLDSAV
jgi:hypothetical protein